MWDGITLIPDEITKAANGQIVITAYMLFAMKVLQDRRWPGQATVPTIPNQLLSGPAGGGKTQRSQRNLGGGYLSYGSRRLSIRHSRFASLGAPAQR